MTSEYVKKGTTEERKSVLLAAAKEEVERLKKAQLVGWDVAADLALAEAHVEAFSR